MTKKESMNYDYESMTKKIKQSYKIRPINCLSET